LERWKPYFTKNSVHSWLVSQCTNYKNCPVSFDRNRAVLYSKAAY
jgi:hypothetical protein